MTAIVLSSFSSFSLFQFNLNDLTSLFLDASSHLYMRVCPSVRPSVGRSVRPSVRPLVGRSRFRQKRENRWFWLQPIMSHAISSSYNHLIIMRTHRWPYGPCLKKQWQRRKWEKCTGFPEWEVTGSIPHTTVCWPSGDCPSPEVGGPKRRREPIEQKDFGKQQHQQKQQLRQKWQFKPLRNVRFREAWSSSPYPSRFPIGLALSPLLFPAVLDFSAAFWGHRCFDRSRSAPPRW